MISIDQAAEMFHAHSQEIFDKLNKTPVWCSVQATIKSDGTWQGTSAVATTDTYRLATAKSNAKSYVIYFSPTRYRTLEAVREGIERWRRFKKTTEIDQTATIFRKHADDILRELERAKGVAPHVIAKVDQNGKWRGTKMLQHAYLARELTRARQTGYAVHFYVYDTQTLEGVLAGIEAWKRRAKGEEDE